MEKYRIAIVGGIRTPFAKAFTDLTDLNASDLAKLTTQELIQRLDFPPEAIDEVIWGAVLPTMTNLNVGREVAGKVSGVMDSFIGERLEMADHNRLFTEDNRLGRKNGRGFYAYENGKKGKVDDTVYRLFDNPRRRSVPYEEVRQRLLAGILNEAAYVLDEGIIDSAAVGDAGAIYGFGFPPFLGGPYWAMDQIGLPAFTEQLQQLAERYGSRFAPAPGLVDRAEAGDGYHAGA